MVLIHIKRTDTDQFLFETTIAASNDELIRELVWGAPLVAQSPRTSPLAPTPVSVEPWPTAPPVPRRWWCPTRGTSWSDSLQRAGSWRSTGP